ncbi:hypothetical protein Ppb6_01375 [Photorhabdus australis subsp. thailandensis]|uniref:Uncharacterized protein n=1 Tax=Photorhabdus australis subsp. thailandensis TaxID=2805096 RepID=A0A1C0U6E3_9GAMM|nr:hypothetical protein [Photorhabdus australis]OCQ53488.1 hypothetical protein Ppb6_01375 [Photorhabdus australis subsp. thailandensis]
MPSKRIILLFTIYPQTATMLPAVSGYSKNGIATRNQVAKQQYTHSAP